MVSDENQSLDEVNNLAENAGVCQSRGIVQSLSYSADWMTEDYKLLELSSDLSTVLQEGDTLTIRGCDEDEAVICTANKTYEIKAADTSNLLLLLPNLSTLSSGDFSGEKTISNVPVVSCFSTYYEVRELRPNIQRLRQLLVDTSYSSGKQVDAIDLYTTEALLGVVQCSEKQLVSALEAMGALEIDGYWRVLEVNYQEKAFSQILALLEEKCWNWKEVPFPEVNKTLSELYPDFVLEHCLKAYGTEVDTEKRMFALSEDKVCRYYAEYILRTAQGKFNFHEFMTAWSESVPDGMTVHDGHLKGVSLINLENQPPVIWHFPETDLPSNPAERFSVLFKTRAKWTEEDIQPYVVNLLSPKQKMSSLFLKYTRTSKDEKGQKVYSLK